MPVESTTCTTCSGLGKIDDVDLCPSCFGRGILPPSGLPGLTAKKLFEVADAINDILGKCNDIIAEQTAQRADLTAALTQIWNKVKDL